MLETQATSASEPPSKRLYLLISAFVGQIQRSAGDLSGGETLAEQNGSFEEEE